MLKVIWACVIAVAILQLAMAVQLLGMQDKINQAIELNLDAAFAKKEAALLEVANERVRNNYYRALENGPFSISEETVSRIISAGAKEADK